MTTYNPKQFETTICQGIAVAENVTAALRLLIKTCNYGAIFEVFTDADENGDDAFMASLKAKYQQAYKRLITEGEVQPRDVKAYSPTTGELAPVKFRHRKAKEAGVITLGKADLRAAMAVLSEREQRLVIEYAQRLAKGEK